MIRDRKPPQFTLCLWQRCSFLITITFRGRGGKLREKLSLGMSCTGRGSGRNGYSRGTTAGGGFSQSPTHVCFGGSLSSLYSRSFSRFHSHYSHRKRNTMLSRLYSWFLRIFLKPSQHFHHEHPSSYFWKYWKWAKWDPLTVFESERCLLLVLWVVPPQPSQTLPPLHFILFLACVFLGRSLVQSWDCLQSCGPIPTSTGINGMNPIIFNEIQIEFCFQIAPEIMFLILSGAHACTRHRAEKHNHNPLYVHCLRRPQLGSVRSHTA